MSTSKSLTEIDLDPVGIPNVCMGQWFQFEISHGLYVNIKEIGGFVKSLFICLIILGVLPAFAARENVNDEVVNAEEYADDTAAVVAAEVKADAVSEEAREAKRLEDKKNEALSGKINHVNSTDTNAVAERKDLVNKESKNSLSKSENKKSSLKKKQFGKLKAKANKQ